MKHLFFYILSLIPVQGMAWGGEGHRVVSVIAERYITEHTRYFIEYFFEEESLVEFSTWLDEVRNQPDYRATATWHWVTIENGKTYKSSTRNKKGDIISAMLAVMLKRKYNRKDIDIICDIRVATHLIGDLHQPLHVSCCNDKGGRLLPVMWSNKNTNLHDVWDNDLIKSYKLSYSELAESLFPLSDKLYEEADNDVDFQNIYEWAEESIAFRNQIYSIGNGKLGNSYFQKNRALLERQLAIAGVRLAIFLNVYFKEFDARNNHK